MTKSYEEIGSIEELLETINSNLANVKFEVTALDSDILIALETEQILVKIDSETVEMKDDILSFEYNTFNLANEDIELDDEFKLKIQSIVYDIILLSLINGIAQTRGDE